MAGTVVHPKQSVVATPAIHGKANGNVNLNGKIPASPTQPPLRPSKDSRLSQPADQDSSKSSGYGLPCAKCHLYYPAHLDSCPTCKNRERVSPLLSADRPKGSGAAALHKNVLPGAVPESAVIDQQREEFLRQFKSQLANAAAEIGAVQGTRCASAECHAGENAGAEICRPCYERLQERLDRYEAALHIDLKEAAQIVYNAVWADPSDPGKTYENAAAALLAELRKRAGASPILSQLHPLSH